MEDLHRARRAHDRDLRGRPRAAPVVAEALRVHDDVRAAVRLAQHDAQAGDRRRRVRVHELGAVADHPAPLEVLAGLEPRGVDERQQRDVEAVAPLDEARGLLGCLDVDGAGPLLRLVGDHADGPPVEPAEAGDEVGRVPGPQLEERVVVEDVLDHDPHVVRRVGPRRHRAPRPDRSRGRSGRRCRRSGGRRGGSRAGSRGRMATRVERGFLVVRRRSRRRRCVARGAPPHRATGGRRPSPVKARTVSGPLT